MKNVIFCLVAILTGCATFKNTVKTTNELATIFCETIAANFPETKEGELSPEEWCEIKDNLDPFVEFVLKAQEKLVH